MAGAQPAQPVPAQQTPATTSDGGHHPVAVRRTLAVATLGVLVVPAATILAIVTGHTPAARPARPVGAVSRKSLCRCRPRPVLDIGRATRDQPPIRRHQGCRLSPPCEETA
jgi:hypothetical protein